MRIFHAWRTFRSFLSSTSSELCSLMWCLWADTSLRIEYIIAWAYEYVAKELKTYTHGRESRWIRGYSDFCFEMFDSCRFVYRVNENENLTRMYWYRQMVWLVRKKNFRVYCLFHLAPRVRVYSHCRGLDIFFNFAWIVWQFYELWKLMMSIRMS